MEWIGGVNLAVNLAFVAKIELVPDEPLAREPRGGVGRKIYRLVGPREQFLAEVELDDEERGYFFPRAIVPAPPGMEVLRLRWDGGGLVRVQSMAVALLLPQEFTEPAIPICAEGQAFFRSNEEEMVLWRFPGREWQEPGCDETYGTIAAAEAAFRERSEPVQK